MLPTSHPLVTPGQLGAMLQAARKSQGLTQSALAARIGLSQSRVSHRTCSALVGDLGVLSRFVEQAVSGGWRAQMKKRLQVSDLAAKLGSCLITPTPTPQPMRLAALSRIRCCRAR